MGFLLLCNSVDSTLALIRVIGGKMMQLYSSLVQLITNTLQSRSELSAWR